jgi:DNA-binding transcriptional LysR family regulator
MARKIGSDARFHYKSNRFRQLKGFVAVAKHESIKKAAEELCLSASTITIQIQSLEEQLGVILFTRHPRKLELTEFGKKFYSTAVGRLQGIDSLYEEFILNSAEENKNHIKIAGHQFVLSHHLPRHLKLIKEKHTDKKLYFEIYNIPVQEGVRKLIEEEVDFILYDIDPCKYPEIYSQEWFREEYTLALPRNHPLSKKRDGDITWKDLSMISPIRTSCNPIQKEIAKFIKQDDFNDSIHYINGTYEICKYTSAIDLGVSFYPKSYISELEESLFKIKDISHLLGYYRSAIGIKKNSNIKPIVKELILELSDKFVF